MRKYPTAFVDESFVHRAGHPGFYLLAAVLVEGGDDLSDMLNAARVAERVDPLGLDYHAAEMHHRGHPRGIEEMLDVIARHAAWTTAVVHIPLGPNRELARRTSLRQLLVNLDSQKIRDVILDSRGSGQEWRDARAQGQKQPWIDRHDVLSYRYLVRDNQISPRMRLVHGNDRHEPGLWLADTFAWSLRRVLTADDPQWWFRIADISTVLEASTGTELRIQDNRAAPPIGEHGPHQPGPSAQPMLLPGQQYPQPSHPGHGQYYAAVLEQAEQARAPDVTRELLSAVREVGANVTELLDEIRHQQLDRPPPPIQPESGTDADRPTSRDAEPGQAPEIE